MDMIAPKRLGFLSYEEGWLRGTKGHLSPGVYALIIALEFLIMVLELLIIVLQSFTMVLESLIMVLGSLILVLESLIMILGSLSIHQQTAILLTEPDRA